MKTLKEYILENFQVLFEVTKDDPTKEYGVSNNTKGVMHEILVGKHLNGGQHMEKHVNEHGEIPEQTHDRLKNQIHPKDYERINARAKLAAEHIKSHIESTHPGHTIHTITHTSKPGDTEKVTGITANQTQDSSDVYVTTKSKSGKVTHHGVSLKVSDNSSKNVPSSSSGAEHSGSHAKEFRAEHKAGILKSYPQLAKKSPNKRKEILRSDPKMHSDIKARNKELLHKVAHNQASELQHHLDSGNYERVVHHIKQVLHAHETPAQGQGHDFFKHTTYETSKGSQHHVSEPSKEYEHIFKDHKNISVEAHGGATHFYYNGKKFASQTHKFNSQSDPLSSLKSKGNAA